MAVLNKRLNIIQIQWREVRDQGVTFIISDPAVI